jgi:site-specific recombinase XerD
VVFPNPKLESRSPKDLIAAFLTSRADTCNDASQATYRAYLRPFETWLKERPISSLTISAYLADSRARKLAPATVGGSYRMIKTLCRWLVEHDLLDRDPFIGAGRVRPLPSKRKRRKVYSDDQVIKMITVSSEWIAERREVLTWWPSDNPYYLRDATQAHALILLLCDSALRAAEVCNLTCGHIRADEFIVLGKGGHEDPAFMSEITRQALLSLAGDRADDDPLFKDKFQKKCTTRALRTCLRHLATRAGVPLVPRPLHAFRHLAARQWLKSGLGDLAIQQLMRHSSLATTRLYTDLDPAELAQLHGKASPIARWVKAAQDAASDEAT